MLLEQRSLRALVCHILLFGQLASGFLIPSLWNGRSSLTTSQSYTGSQSTTSWYTLARDGLIERIWQVSSGATRRTPTDAPAAGVATASSDIRARYGDDIVLRFSFTNAEEVRALSGAAQTLVLDVWEINRQWADIRISRSKIPALLGLLPASMHQSHVPLITNLAQAIQETYPIAKARPGLQVADPSRHQHGPQAPPSTSGKNVFFQDYQPLSVIVPWMHLLQSLFPSHTRVISIGRSFEGRDIPAFRLGVHPTNDEKPSGPRKTIVVTAGSHAREWVSTSTVNYVAYSFITMYGKSSLVTKLLEKFDFVFVPTINPDGYAYTWETDRLWRKNRQQTDLPFCTGLDIDRSFDFQWNGAPSSEYPCSGIYPGNAPFEAVEARRLAEWARNETANNNVALAGFLDLHSYSQQVLYPYSYSCDPVPPSLENLEELAIGLAKAIRLGRGEAYVVTSACEGGVASACSDSCDDRYSSQWTTDDGDGPLLDTGAGSALDYFYQILHVPYAYQLKLRDTGTYGFLLPSHNIIPTGKEAFRAVQHFANFLAGHRGIEDPHSDAGIHDTVEMRPMQQSRDEESRPDGDQPEL